MKLINRTLFTACFSALCIVNNVSAEEYRFVFKLPSSEKTADSPQTAEAGKIVINGQPIAAFNTSFVDPMSNNNERIDFKAQSIETEADADILAGSDLYAVPNGTILVPKGWLLTQGGIGANGSVSYTFSPVEATGYFTFLDTSACVGCSQSEASVFFPEALDAAKANDFIAYDKTNLSMQTVRLRPNLIKYSVEQGEQRLSGLVYYDTNANFPFWKVEISLPKANEALADSLLNQFIPAEKQQ